MKEKNKKIKFKKWYLMPIFVVAFLCVFGFSIVKPVKAEYYTEDPTFIGNTQYAFDVQMQSPVYDEVTFMFPTEVYNYTESLNLTSPVYTAISVIDPNTGENTNYGYFEQRHYFNGDLNNANYGYTLYVSDYHFISLFTIYDSYLTFVNEEFYFIPSSSYSDIFTNFNFSEMPYFNSEILVPYNTNSNTHYMNLVSCEFNIELFSPQYDDNGNVISTEVKKILTTYDFPNDNQSLRYDVNGVSTDILVYPNVGNGSYSFYPYRLVDYLIGNHYMYYDFFHITDFKLFTHVPAQTQTTGIDEFYQIRTPITRNDLIGFNITDYTSKITLNSYNLGASEFLQYEVYKNNILHRVNVDTTSWLITAVGAFMNAELFPGFAIGGIFAVMVAFPLVVWFLKVVLGG